MTTKSVLFSAGALCLGIGLAVYSRRLPAQVPFNGTRISFSDFYACDPAKTQCSSQMNYVETTSGDLFTRSTIWSKPGTIGEDFVVIDKATEYIQVYPEVKEYFRMSRVAVRPKPVVDSSPDCANAAGAKATLLGHSKTAGYVTADYQTESLESTNTVSLARDLGCLAIRTVFIWKPADSQHTARPTFHVATNIQTSFDTSDLTIPSDMVEVSPLKLRHDVYVRRGALGLLGSKEAAEADWKARLADGRLVSVTTLNDRWLAHRVPAE